MCTTKCSCTCSMSASKPHPFPHRPIGAQSGPLRAGGWFFLWRIADGSAHSTQHVLHAHQHTTPFATCTWSSGSACKRAQTFDDVLACRIQFCPWHVGNTALKSRFCYQPCRTGAVQAPLKPQCFDLLAKRCKALLSDACSP